VSSDCGCTAPSAARPAVHVDVDAGVAARRALAEEPICARVGDDAAEDTSSFCAVREATGDRRRGNRRSHVGTEAGAQAIEQDGWQVEVPGVVPQPGAVIEGLELPTAMQLLEERHRLLSEAGPPADRNAPTVATGGPIEDDRFLDVLREARRKD
jgi:hypothetical protein